MNTFVQHAAIAFFFLILVGAGCSENSPQAFVLDFTPTTTPERHIVTSTFHMPVFLFHHVGEPPAGISKGSYEWYVSEEKFKEVLNTISEYGYTAITSKELLQFLEQGTLPEKPLMIVFDDGAIDFYTHAFPLLQEYKMKSVMHLQSRVRSDNWLNEEQIQELQTTGLVEFGSHTKYHAYLTRISKEEARAELEESKQDIEKIIGEEVVSLAYPFGLYSNEVMELSRDVGYDVAFSLRGGHMQHINELLELRRTIITNQTNIEALLTL